MIFKAYKMAKGVAKTEFKEVEALRT